MMATQRVVPHAPYISENIAERPFRLCPLQIYFIQEPKDQDEN